MTAHIFSAGMDIKANEKINIFAQVNFSKSESSFDPIQMQTTAQTQEALAVIHPADYNYTMVNKYSDLSYDFLNLHAGGMYQMSSNLAFTLDIDYFDLSDNLGYVYGNESGSFYVIRTGFKYGVLGW